MHTRMTLVVLISASVAMISGVTGGLLWLVGILVEPPVRRGQWLLFAAVLIALLGMMALLVVDCIDWAHDPSTPSAISPHVPEFVRIGASFLLFAGLLIAGPAFLWERLQQKREERGLAIEAEARGVMVDRVAAEPLPDAPPP